MLILENLSIFFSLLGAVISSWAGIRYLIKPGRIAKSSLLICDAGASKISDLTYSACYIVSGFLFFFLSSLTTLFINSCFLFYLFIALSIVVASIFLMFYFPKKIIAREDECLNKKKLHYPCSSQRPKQASPGVKLPQWHVAKHFPWSLSPIDSSSSLFAVIFLSILLSRAIILLVLPNRPSAQGPITILRP
jgi:hypothetical protein